MTYLSRAIPIPSCPLNFLPPSSLPLLPPRTRDLPLELVVVLLLHGRVEVLPPVGEEGVVEEAILHHGRDLRGGLRESREARGGFQGLEGVGQLDGC